jgi:DNA-binding winged helix-turn-helix (wHTH) protein
MKVFAPFRFDPTNQCLWRRADTGEEARVLLAPKAFALLSHLVEHAGQLVTHEELLDAVWPGSVVEPQAVKRHIFAVRSALGDRPKNSLFIETVAKRGYRFIAPVSEQLASSPVVAGSLTPGTLVGRGAALGELREAWQRTLSGELQLVFITGEPGIGKTTLAEEFCRQLALSGQSLRIAHGQCIEGYGSKEAYGPMLDALGPLCRGPQAEAIVQILSAQARRRQPTSKRNRGISNRSARTARSAAPLFCGWRIHCQNKSRCARFSSPPPLLRGFSTRIRSRHL